MGSGSARTRTPASTGAHGYPHVDVLDRELDWEAVAAVPEAILRRHLALPIAETDGRLVVAFADPSDIIALDDVRTASGREIVVVHADMEAIAHTLERLEAVDRLTESLIAEAGAKEEPAATRAEDEPANFDDAPIVKAIDRIIRRAVRQRASDVHVEPKKDDVRVRFRIDGVLLDAMRLPRTLHSSVVSRLKIMANLDIATKRIPQDGRMTFDVGASPVDIRVATMPSVWGEEVILRILDNPGELPTLDELGFSDADLRRFEDAFRHQNGCILVVGPTGSGKTTTLYSTLAALDEVGRKIITLEDPVEYRLNGLTQIHVDTALGLSFGKALRSVLRSDPDVVMVGEIRDGETAKVAIEASLTGHRVLSTLHTSDAAGALTRLMEMGVEPFLVSSAVSCVISQRLVRRLCDRCKQPYEASPALAEQCGFARETLTFYRARGCGVCNGTGYKGRVAVFEVLAVDDELAKLITERATSEEIATLARSNGMTTVRDDAFEKVKLGVTSVDEALRVALGADMVHRPRKQTEIVPRLKNRDRGPIPSSQAFVDDLERQRVNMPWGETTKGESDAARRRPVIDRGYRF